MAGVPRGERTGLKMDRLEDKPGQEGSGPLASCCRVLWTMPKSLDFILTMTGSHQQTFEQSVIGTYLFSKDSSDCSVENRFHEGKNGIWATNKEESSFICLKDVGGVD